MLIVDAGTSQLLTAWLPLGAVTPDLGSLLVAAGSHRLQSFAGVRSTYGATQATRSAMPSNASCLKISSGILACVHGNIWIEFQSLCDALCHNHCTYFTNVDIDPLWWTDV